MQERKKSVRRGVATRGEKVRVPAGKGRVLDKGPSSAKNRKSNAAAAPAAKKVAPAPQSCACPECGKKFRTDEAVQTHRHAAHGTAETVVGDMTRCTECGSLVRDSNMALHYRRKHAMV